MVHYTFNLFRCGDSLIALYQSPAVQRYLNGTPSSTLLKFKLIYQPGLPSLRKVSRLMSTIIHVIYICDRICINQALAANDNYSVRAITGPRGQKREMHFTAPKRRGGSELALSGV